jgi:hypothetical protein
MEVVVGINGLVSRLGVPRALLLLGVALLVPACGKTPDPGPTILSVSPQGSSVPRETIIYINWDRPLDTSTVPTGFALNDSLGNSISATGAWNAVLNQVSITPTSALAGATTFTVTAFGTIMAADGKGFSGFAYSFQTIPATVAPPNAGQPSFAGLTSATPTVAPATASIDLAWTAATDTPDGDSIKYDVYMSTTSGGEDFSLPPLLTTNSGTGVTVNNLNGLGSGVTYFFMVRAREATSGNIEFNTVEHSAKTN